MRLFIVDAFAERPFQGNPAAVCPLEAPADPVWMQRVAAEMNLSETAFVVARSDGFDLRWFTPMFEVDLCGHATLASAHLLWELGLAPRNGPIRFHTKSGVLTCRRTEPEMIELDFPAEPAKPAAPPADLAAALGAEPLFVGRNRFDLLVELASERALRAVRPDFGRLARIEVRGVIVTARSGEPRFDFVSRFFAPAVGVNEDPVCGSAHCCLGPFWSERLRKYDLVAFQASQRGGIVGVRVERDRVVLRGSAITVLAGELRA
jgi:PhzF family phenazine biosynthesis protein